MNFFFIDLEKIKTYMCYNISCPFAAINNIWLFFFLLHFAFFSKWKFWKKELLVLKISFYL